MKSFIFFSSFFLSLVSCQDSSAVVGSDTAWIIVASCLVMIMTPGLAFFYGGLVRQKSFVNILGQCLILFSIVTALWAFIGYSLAFGDSKSQFLGGVDLFSLRNVNYAPNAYAPTIPGLLFYFYQNKFAAITPCLFIGATAERVRFKSVVLFASLWLIVGYCPIAHWNWNLNGFLHTLGVLDFAGGNVVHLSSGSAALAAAFFTDFVSEREKDIKVKRTPTSPRHLEKALTKHGRQVQENPEDAQSSAKESTAFVVLGTALLWFGWFGFNAGSALSTSDQSVLALINTNMAAGCALLTWYFLETIGGKKASVIGMCVGAVCGLVGITPACGYVPIYASGIIGVFSSLATFSFYKCLEKCRYRPDDRLGVFGCHGVSGITGSILIGFFADKDLGAPIDGIFQEGGGHLLGVQIAGICCSFAWSFSITMVLLTILYLVGLYVLIDEGDENESNDFDEQAVFMPDIEKMIAKYGISNNKEKEKEFELINQKMDKIDTRGQVVFEDQKVDTLP